MLLNRKNNNNNFCLKRTVNSHTHTDWRQLKANFLVSYSRNSFCSSNYGSISELFLLIIMKAQWWGLGYTKHFSIYLHDFIKIFVFFGFCFIVLEELIEGYLARKILVFASIATCNIRHDWV